MNTDILHIALVVLAVAGIWAIVELALMIRKARSTVDNLGKEVGQITTNANATLEQVQPMMDKVDGMLTDLEPAIEQVQPLMEKANTAIDVVTVDLASVNDILVDVSSVTDTASNVTSTVSKAANSAVSGVAGVVGKFTGGSKKKGNRLAARTSARAERNEGEVAEEFEPTPDFEVEVEAKGEESKTYFTYGAESSDGE